MSNKVLEMKENTRGLIFWGAYRLVVIDVATDHTIKQNRSRKRWRQPSDFKANSCYNRDKRPTFLRNNGEAILYKKTQKSTLGGSFVLSGESKASTNYSASVGFLGSEGPFQLAEWTNTDKHEREREREREGWGGPSERDRKVGGWEKCWWYIIKCWVGIGVTLL